jgi:S1-C subfamily serine protease
MIEQHTPTTAPDPARPPEATRSSRTARATGWVRRLGGFAAGVVAVLIALAIYNALFPAPAALTQQDVNDTVASALASQTPAPAFSEQAYAAIAPAFVVVRTTTSGAGSSSGDGLGSGVVINDQGDILTSLHVVADAGSITLTFADGSTSSATIASSQPDKDIAVLQADQLPAQLTPATIGDPGSLRVGSEAYVVGDPLGLTGSLTAGVVSGLDRTFKEPNGGPTLTGLIQIDAAVNPGNSGGPLVDRDGRLLGIVTGLINPTGQDVFIGIGLAVPIDAAGGPAGLPPY